MFLEVKLSALKRAELPGDVLMKGDNEWRVGLKVKQRL
jgi:hypothetical protein